MGAKYETNQSSGYNSAPPADDGSQTASNLITWAKHKTKLTDPLKTLADAINTDLVAAFDYAVRRISASDSLVAGDHMRTVEISPSVSTIVTVTLADAATMTNIYRVYIKNSGSKECTIARTTSGDTIDGVAANISIPAGSSFLLTTNNAADGYLIAGVYPLEITNLTEETAPAESDTVAIYDLSATALRKVQLRYLRNPLTLETEQATTSGTTKDFTIPSWAKRITVLFDMVSTNGTSNLLVQLGDGGGIESSGYTSGVVITNTPSSASSTAGFIVTAGITAASAVNGKLELCLQDAANFTWVGTSIVNDTTNLHVGAGTKALSAALTTVRVTSVSADTFDAGSVNVLYD